MINVDFDFTNDTPEYWDRFWKCRDDLGLPIETKLTCTDPDSKSPTLREYHKNLWSKELPCGETMKLEYGKDRGAYLIWKGLEYGSDTIVNELLHYRLQSVLEEVKAHVENYREYVENNIRKSYTIGGTIIFPRHPQSMNQMRGMNAIISDRWDLTMECIRRYYAGDEDNPLQKTMDLDRDFYELFVDFKGYVDYFYLQDCVSEDYNSVKLWCGDTFFEGSGRGRPKTLDDYTEYMDNQNSFLKNRNERIKEEVSKRG